jgi:hypothetical protein
MSGVWKAQCGEFLIGGLEGDFLMVSMIIPRWDFRSKVPKCKSQEMSLLDWGVVGNPPSIKKRVFKKKSVEHFSRHRPIVAIF